MRSRLESLYPYFVFLFVWDRLSYFADLSCILVAFVIGGGGNEKAETWNNVVVHGEHG